jgi:drug/metabolite transporter (DMT)-like permease
MKPSARAHIAVLFTNLFFAINFTLVKMVSPSLIGAYAVNVVRAGISLILFWLIWMLGKTNAGIERKDVGRFIFCALTGIVINQTLFIKGLTLTSATHASLLMLGTPLVVSFFASWVLKEKFTVFKSIGLLLGVGGSVFLILQKENSQHASNYLWGDLLILLNAISYSIFFIAVKPLMKTYSPMHVIRWVFTIGFIVLLPIGWMQITHTDWHAFNAKYLVVLFAIAITGTFLAYYFNAYGLQHLGASVTGTYIYTQPVFAVLIAVLFLNESFSWQKGLSAVLIFAGVYLVSFRRKGNSQESGVGSSESRVTSRESVV